MWIPAVRLEDQEFEVMTIITLVMLAIFYLIWRKVK